MIITSVTAVCFKGGNFNYALSPATAIIGPNMTGKTAIIQAIRLALAGYLPECGKTAKATWELSSGSKMTVVAEFNDNQPAIQRSYYLDGSTVKIMGPDESRFESLPLLNAEAYFSMTDTERTAYAFEKVVLPDKYTVAGIIAQCEQLSFGDEHTEQIEEAKATIIKGVRGYFGPGAFVDPTLSSAIPSVQEALTNALYTLRESFTQWNKRAKDTQGAVTTMAELKLRETEVAAAALNIEGQITKARASLDALMEERGKLQAQHEEGERASRKSKSLRASLDAIPANHSEEIDRLTGYVEDAKKKLQMELTANARKNLVAAIDSFKVDRYKHQAKVAEFEQSSRKANEQLAGLVALKSCPFCKSKGKDWKVNLEAELTEVITKAVPAGAEAREGLEKCEKALAQAVESLKINDEWAGNNARLNSQMEKWNRDIDNHRTAEANEAQRRKEFTAELKALKKLPSVSAADMLKLNDDIVRARDEMTTLERKVEAETRLKQDLKRAAEAEIEHLNAKARVTVIKKVAELLKEIREAMVTEVFTGLLIVANKLVERILKSPLALHDNTVGRWEGSKFIPHRVFSGTEKALTYIAIATALSAQAPLKLVILDEFGRLDDYRQELVIDRLLTAIKSGIIDQFIVVGTNLPDDMSRVGLEVIRVQ